MNGAGSGSGASRDLILGRVRRALDGRERREHPGTLAAPVPLASPGGAGPLPHPAGNVAAFSGRLTLSGGQVVRCADPSAPGDWLAGVLPDLLTGGLPGHDAAGVGATLAVGSDVAARLTPALPRAPASEATVGLSVALAGAADTGSVLLSADGGRAVQLLPPVHVVWLHEADLHARLEDALDAVGGSLPRALGIHSGPSKSADIGRVVVQGVHGPGRLIVILLGGAG